MEGDWEEEVSRRKQQSRNWRTEELTHLLEEVTLLEGEVEGTTIRKLPNQQPNI